MHFHCTHLSDPPLGDWPPALIDFDFCPSGGSALRILLPRPNFIQLRRFFLFLLKLQIATILKFARVYGRFDPTPWEFALCFPSGRLPVSNCAIAPVAVAELNPPADRSLICCNPILVSGLDSGLLDSSFFSNDHGVSVQ